jgi:hypothetical protein
MRVASFIALTLCLFLVACGDPRREAVREYLETHPPEGFTLDKIPDDFGVTKAGDGTSEAVLNVTYRLTHATVETRDALSLPPASKIAERLNAVRGWALSSLPASDPTREKIVTATAAARAPFPVKRIVTPAGTPLEALAHLTLTKKGDLWKVEPKSLAVDASGNLDKDPSIPLEGSAGVTARLRDLEATAGGLEELRKQYLAKREQAAARSLADMRARLQTGNTYEGRLPGSASIRLVISRGIDSENTAVAVLTVQREEQSTARYVGAVVQQPSGEYVWRAAQVTTLSGSDPLADVRSRPILTLATTPSGLILEINPSARPPVSIQLNAAEKVDLIPETPAQGTE